MSRSQLKQQKSKLETGHQTQSTMPCHAAQCQDTVRWGHNWKVFTALNCDTETESKSRPRWEKTLEFGCRVLVSGSCLWWNEMFLVKRSDLVLIGTWRRCSKGFWQMIVKNVWCVFINVRVTSVTQRAEAESDKNSHGFEIWQPTRLNLNDVTSFCILPPGCLITSHSHSNCVKHLSPSHSESPYTGRRCTLWGRPGNLQYMTGFPASPLQHTGYLVSAPSPQTAVCQSETQEDPRVKIIRQGTQPGVYLDGRVWVLSASVGIFKWKLVLLAADRFSPLLSIFR